MPSISSGGAAASASTLTVFDINLKSAPYNCVGDGVTDDTAGVQAAWTAAGGPYGKKVYGHGTFKVSDTIVCANSVGVQVLGTSTSSTVYAPTAALAGKPVFKFVNVRDSSIHDLTIAGVAAPNSPSMAIEVMSDAGAIVSYNNTFRDLIIGSAFVGFTTGVHMTCAVGQDHNNDQHTFRDIAFVNIASNCLRIGHSNSLQHTVDNCKFVSQDTGVYADAGSATLRDCWFNCGSWDMQLGVDTAQQQGYHPWYVLNCRSEDHARLLKTVAALVEVYVSGYERQGGYIAGGDVVSIAGATSHVHFSHCSLNFGQPNQKFNVTGAACKVSIQQSRLGFTHYLGFGTGKFRHAQNYHESGTVDLSGIASTCERTEMGESGGGFSASAAMQTMMLRADTPIFWLQSTKGGKSIIRAVGGSGEFHQWISDGVAHTLDLGYLFTTQRIGKNQTELVVTDTGITTGNIPFKAGNGIRPNNGNTSRPAASATYRGQLWYTESGSGVADAIEICVKGSGDTYSWVSLA